MGWVAIGSMLIDPVFVVGTGEGEGTNPEDTIF